MLSVLLVFLHWRRLRAKPCPGPGTRIKQVAHDDDDDDNYNDNDDDYNDDDDNDDNMIKMTGPPGLSRLPMMTMMMTGPGTTILAQVMEILIILALVTMTI